MEIFQYYLSDDKVPVQSTNIPYSLEHMLEILRVEDEENGGSTAVCYLNSCCSSSWIFYVYVQDLHGFF